MAPDFDRLARTPWPIASLADEISQSDPVRSLGARQAAVDQRASLQGDGLVLGGVTAMH